MACVRVCPADAVAVEGSQIRIVDETCTRCGLCVPACPHDAIKAAGDLPRALELALSGRAALILGVECAVFFYPATPEQVVNACYAAGFRTVHRDRKSTRLNSSHLVISYAVFCLKKKPDPNVVDC